MEMHSARTISYVKAMIEEGDNFDYDAWLKRAQEQEQGEAEELKMAQLTAAAVQPHLRSFTAHSAKSIRSPTERARVPIELRKPSPSKHGCELHDELTRIWDAWEDLQTNRDRDAVYDYLRGVYTIVTNNDGKQKTRRLIRRAVRSSGIFVGAKAEPFSAIIRCTSERHINARTISKWSRALRFVAYRKRAPRKLKRFMKQMGGINACAAQFANLRRAGRAG